MKKGRKGPPGPEDAALWAHVVKTVRPLHAKKPARAEKAAEKAETPAAARRPVAPQNPLPLPRGSAAPAAGFDAATARRLKKGRLPVEGTLDLHGMTQDEAFAAFSRFIARAAGSARRNLLVITGKGLKPGSGVLRRLLPLWAGEDPRILACTPAQPRDGGGGAFYVRLGKPGK